MRGEKERGGDSNKGRTEQQERRKRRAERERYNIDGREDTTTDDDDEEEEEERPHGPLTAKHGRDVADVPRGQVLVEGFGRGEPYVI